MKRMLWAAVVLAAALPATAGADSIVFIKGSNVWIAHADGSGARQFTQKAYGWGWPSEADDGTVVVAGGLQRINPDGSDSSGTSEIYRFKPDGNQIGGAMPTWGSYSTPQCPTYGPRDVHVSPDGTKIAYTELTCSTSQNTVLWTPADSTGLNFPAPQQIGQADYAQPSWYSGSKFLVTHFGPTITDSQPYWYMHDVAEKDDEGEAGWAEPSLTSPGFQGVISRSGTRLAVFEQDAGSWMDGVPRLVRIWLYAAPDLATAESSDWGAPKCKVTLDASKYPTPLYMNPSVSADGAKLVWGSSDGVMGADVSNLANCASVQPALLVAGGSEPFYSQGNMGTPAANPVQPGTTQPTPGSTTTTTTTTTAGKTVASFTFKPRKVRAKHKVTFTSTSRAPGGSLVDFAWSFGDHKKAFGPKVTHKFRKRGTYKVTLTVRDAQRHSAKATVKVKVVR